MNNILEKFEEIGNQKLKDADNLCRKVKQSEYFFKKYSLVDCYLEIPDRGWIAWDLEKKRIILKLETQEKPFLEHKINDRLECAIYYEMLVELLLKQNGK